MKFKLIAFVILFVVALFAGCSVINLERIDAGNVGIKVNLTGGTRGVDDITYATGWVAYSPLTTAVYEFPTFVQHKDYPEFPVIAKGGSVFGVSPKLNYQVVQSQVPAIFRQYRVGLKQIEDQFLLTSIQKAYQEVANSYTPDSLMSNKVSFDNKVQATLATMINKQGFDVKQLASQLEVPNTLKASIDAKNIQQQTNLQVQAKRQQAEGEAQVLVAQAEGEAKAKRIAADAEAYSNRVKQTSLTPMLVQQQWINKWDGALPTYQTGSGTSMIMQMPK